MNPEDVLINFVVENAQALDAAKAVEDSITSIQGAVDQMHGKWVDSAKEVKDLLDPMVDKMLELNDALKDSDEHWQKKADNVSDFNDKIKESTEQMEKQITSIEGVQKGFENATPGLQELTQAVKDGTWQIGFYTAAWNMALQYGAQAITKTTSAVSDLISNLSYLQVSAAMGGAEMERLTGDIIHAATETGLAFDAVAAKARHLYDYSGLKDGLGDVVVAGEHMNRVFGMSGEEFGRFAATAVKLSDGILTGTKLMEQFDHVVGITGYKMETLLTNLEAIAKNLAKITGGGANFAKAMEAVTRHTAEASAAIQQLGGDADGYQEIIGQIADPSQWDSVIDALGPGIAGSLHEMQAALTNGDMERFNALMSEGATLSKDMGAGMDNMTRAALGFDFRQIEVLSQLDPSKMQEMAEATKAQASVAERSAALTQNISNGIDRLWNNVVAVLLKAVMPMLVEISAAITYMNEKLSDNQGEWDGIVTVLGAFLGAVGWAIGLIFRAIGALSDMIGTTNTLILTLLGVVAAVFLVGKAFGTVVGMLMKPIAMIGDAVGKLVGNVFEETMAGMGRGMKQFNDASKGAEKAALTLLMLGGAMFLFGAGIAFVAGVPLANVIAMFTGFIVTMMVLSQVASTAAPQMYILAGAMLMLGGAMFLFGAGLMMVADVPLANVIAMFTGFIVTMMVLSQVASTAAPQMYILAGAMLMLGAAMFLFGAGLMMVADVPIATIAVTIIGLIAVLLALSLASAYLAPAIGIMLAFGAAMMMVGASFVLLGMGLSLMSDVDFVNVAIGLVLLAGAAYLFAPAAMIMGAMAPFVMLMAVGLFMLGLALIPLAILAPVLTTIGFGLMALAGGLLMMIPVAMFAPLLAGGIYILAGALAVLGFAIMPIGLGMILMAIAFDMLASVDYTTIATGMGMIAGAFFLMLPMMAFLWLFGLGMGSLASTLEDIAEPAAKAGDGMMDIATALYLLANAGDILAKVDGVKIGENIAAMTGAMKTGGTGFDPAEMQDTIASMTMVVDMVAGMSDKIDDIIYVSQRLGESEAALNLIYDSFFDPDTGLLVTATKQIYYSLSTPGVFWGRNSMDISGQMEAINGVIDALDRMVDMYADLAVMGAVMRSEVNDRNVGVNIMVGVAIVFGILAGVVKFIDDELTDKGWLWDSAKDISTQLESMTGVMDILERFNNMFAALAIMGGVMAQAGSQAPTYEQQIKDGINAVIQIMAGAITTINEQIDAGGWFSSGDTIDDDVKETLETVSDILMRITNTYTQLAIMGGVLQAAGGNGRSILFNIHFGIAALFGEDGIVPCMLKTISENIDSGGWFSDGNMVDREVLDSVEIVAGLVNRITGFYTQLAIMGGVLQAQGANGFSIRSNIMYAIQVLFGEEGIVPRLFSEIGDNLDNIDTRAVECSMTAINQIASTMESVTEIFGTMAVLGGVLDKKAGDGVTFMQKAKDGVEAMFGADGIVTELMGSIRRASAAMRVDPEVYESINGAFTVVDRLVGMTENLTALGDGSAQTTGILAMVDAVARVNTTLTPDQLGAFGSSLNTYADIIEGVNSRFAEMDLSPMTDVAMAMDDVTASMTNDVSIAAEGGAELAMEELEQARNQHQLTVENLLTEIRDGIRAMGGREAQTLTTPAENTSMDFAGLFGDSSGDSF